jgi:hypothetical protein
MEIGYENSWYGTKIADHKAQIFGISFREEEHDTKREKQQIRKKEKLQVRARSNVSRFPRWLVTFLEAWLR